MNPIVGRLVPLAAVAAANCINIPLMRRQELQKGITLVDDNYNSLNVESKKAAVQGISAVIASRIAMATPGMGKFPHNCYASGNQSLDVDLFIPAQC